MTNTKTITYMCVECNKIEVKKNTKDIGLIRTTNLNVSHTCEECIHKRDSLACGIFVHHNKKECAYCLSPATNSRKDINAPVCDMHYKEHLTYLKMVEETKGSE